MKIYNTCTCIFGILMLLLSNTTLSAQTNPVQPNILLIIADDLGVDISNGYQSNALMPTTPNLDALRTNGLTFTNCWTAPQCTPTRASIMSGKYGVNTGVKKPPGNLDAGTHISVFKELATQTSNAYEGAVVGKWHISNPVDYTHPMQHGVDFYTGVFQSQVADYYAWDKVVSGAIVPNTNYATTELTDDALTWINARSSPWFMWLAHVAPHSPIHTPPPSLYTLNPIGTNFRKYVASIEAMDAEIGRLLANMTPAVLANTVIIYIGDNGTPGNFLQGFPAGRGKGTVYQGGIHVPLIVSGAGVTRTGETEDALVHSVDIYATVLEIAGASLPGGKYNSFSFKSLLSNASAPERPYNYVDYERLGTGGDDFAIRDSQFKLVQFSDGTQEFYDLINDPFEQTNLLPTLNAAEQTAYDDLEIEAIYIRTDWSCRDLIQNGTETSVDVGGTYCSGLPVCTFDNSTSTTNIGCCAMPNGENRVSEMVYNDIRTVSSTDFPDHEYCYNSPSQQPTIVNYYLEMDASPSMAAQVTPVTNTNTNRPQYHFGVAMNGVAIAPAPATPFIFENPNTGEYNWDWVFEPTNNQGSGMDKVGLDCASAHTGPQGYHYHGNMFEYVENIQAGLSTTSTPPSAPLQIGWASDGYPIIYRFGPDGVGGLSLLQPSYQLKPGDRPGDGVNSPCGPYNGKYTNDYEYKIGVGDLDECNGIQRNITLNTICGPQTFDYFYVITEGFPQVPRCMVGTPDVSFRDAAIGTCYKPLTMQEVVLNSGGSITVGTNTYNAIGTYQDILTSSESCDSIVVTKITAILPLELLSFEVKNRNDKYADLIWETIDEINVSHFQIEKSKDGSNWEKIGKVNAVGNSALRHRYQFKDNLWNSSSEYVYYRLKIIDLDNSFEYSPIESIKIIRRNHLEIVQDINTQIVYIDFISEFPKSFAVELLDLSGKTILSKNTSFNNGRNILFDNLNDINSGMYLISIRDNNGFVYTKRIITQ